MNPKKYNNLRIPGNVTTPFGGSTRGESFHPGLDIANKPGTLVQALTDGVVTDVGPTSNGMGNIVRFKDAKGGVQQYGHLQKALVKRGDKIRRGQPIAKMGDSGNSYSPSGGDATHLDVRIVNAYKQFVDPTAYYNKA